MKTMRNVALSLLVSGALTYMFWGDLAVLTAPKRAASASDSELAKQANRFFWSVFHSGQYERAEEVLVPLQAAWYENPNDPVLVSHMAWAHIWLLAESERVKELSPRILDHAILSQKYFAEAVALVPDEPRYMGFLSSAELAVASITRNEALRRQGYFRGLRSIEMWPAFNGFTAAYFMIGSLPPEHDKFSEAVEMLWQNNDDCSVVVQNRDDFDLSDFFQIDPRTMPDAWRRACINSWIAPYNVEGYLLVFGDALVKSGNWQLGTKVYQETKRTPDFATWPFAGLIDARIRDAQQNVARFAQTTPPGKPVIHTGMMFNSSYACMGCHQHSPASRAKYSPPDFVRKTL